MLFYYVEGLHLIYNNALFFKYCQGFRICSAVALLLAERLQ